VRAGDGWIRCTLNASARLEQAIANLEWQLCAFSKHFGCLAEGDPARAPPWSHHCNLEVRLKILADEREQTI